MLRIKKIRWQNLLSYGNEFTELDLDTYPTTLIEGANGSGKSTFLDALKFAWYGVAYRDITKPALVNSITGAKTLVEVEFEANNRQYVVRRGIKPNLFEIIQDGKLINQDSASKDYQEMLETNILKINSKSFDQIVVVGAANYTPFMQLSASHRREVIESLLDIEIFSVMNSLLKEKVSTNKTDIQDNDYQIGNIRVRIEADKKRVADLQSNNQDIIKAKIDEANRCKAENLKLQPDIERLEAESTDLGIQLQAFTAIKDKRAKVLAERTNTEQAIQKLIGSLHFYHQHDNCPTCRQEISEDFKETLSKGVQTEIDGHRAYLAKVQKGLDKLDEQLKPERDVATKVREVLQNLSSLKSTFDLNKRLIAHAKTEVESLMAKNKAIVAENDNLKQLTEDLKKAEDVRSQLLHDKEVLSLAAQLLKDGGIKSLIIKQYVPIMNKLINKYLSALDFFVNFEIDETFKETIKSRGRDNFTYESFSQGEKLRIDLALLFTFRTISKLRNSTNCNLLVLDEILDSSLDMAGVDEFLRIINNLTADNNTFIISHRGDVLLDKFSRVLRFQKVKNFSRIAA